MNNFISQYKSSKYLTLFSTDATKITNAAGTNNIQFSWTFNNLKLSSSAKIGLVNIVCNSVDNTLTTLYCEELLNDGYTSFNTYPVLYSGRGLINTNITNIIYHNINAINLNNIDVYVGTGIPATSADKYNGVSTTLTFAITLHLIDDLQELVQPELISVNNKDSYQMGNKSIIKIGL